MEGFAGFNLKFLHWFRDSDTFARYGMCSTGSSPTQNESNLLDLPINTHISPNTSSYIPNFCANSELDVCFQRDALNIEFCAKPVHAETDINNSKPL